MLNIEDDKYKKLMSYVGIPFNNGSLMKENGLDCLTFIIVVLQEVFGKYGLSNKIINNENLRYPEDWFKDEAMWTLYSDRIKDYCDTFEYIEGKSEPQLYDILFFSHYNDPKRLTHVGMYIGNNKFVHCMFKKGVTVSNLIYMRSKLLFYGREKKENN
ncbi:MAG: NlpC/P60 family protein [Clostridia bacterium]|nr:NlpC/P60 family protein [Clostridia bacterium]